MRRNQNFKLKVVILLVSLGICSVTWCGIGLAQNAALEQRDPSCFDADKRIQKAIARTNKSAFRAQIAVLRVISELSRMGVIVTLPEQLKLSTNEIPNPALLDDAASMVTHVEALSDFSMLALRESYEGYDIEPRPKRSKLRAPNTYAEPSNCLRDAYLAEIAAFRAEQAAQLAEVAADQAISRADNAASAHAR